jgi:hypothetical protein
MAVLLFCFSYPIRKRRECPAQNAVKRKYFQEPGAEAVLDDSDCGHKSEKLCRQLASQASSGRADQTVKTADMRRANIRKTDKRMG